MMRRLLADRDIRLYLVGQTISTAGDTALWLAMSVWTMMLTGSASAAGMTVFMLTLGTLVGPLGGVLADRFRRRPLLIATNVVTAVVVLLLLLVHSRHQVWLIDVVMFGYGVSLSVLGPAQTAFLPSVVDKDLLGSANSAMQTMQQGLRLVTPLLGVGALAAFGARPVIVGDVVTFLVAAGTLLALRTRETTPARTRQRWLTEVTAGARHIRGTAVLRQVTVAGALIVTTFGFSETVIFAVVADGLRRPTSFLGVLTTAEGVGAIAAGSVAAALIRRLGETRLVRLGAVATALGFLLLATSSTPVVLVGSALIGVSLPWIIVGSVTLLQRRTPADLIGRADAALGLAVTVPQTIAIALGAALVAAVDYRILLLGLTAVDAGAAVYLVAVIRAGPDRRTVPDHGPSGAEPGAVRGRDRDSERRGPGGGDPSEAGPVPAVR